VALSLSLRHQLAGFFQNVGLVGGGVVWVGLVVWGGLVFSGRAKCSIQLVVILIFAQWHSINAVRRSSQVETGLGSTSSAF